MPSSEEEESVLEAVRSYYNNPETVQKFNLWGGDARRPGVSGHHLGLDDVPRFRGNVLLRFFQMLRHKRAVERTTRLIMTESQLADGQWVLDAGCGTGAVSFPIAEKYLRSHVYGVSLSHLQLNIARKYQQEAHVRNAYFTEQNYTRLAFRDGSFDRVLFVESFCHAPDKRETVSEASRVLKPGGKLVIVDPLHLKPPPPDQASLRDALGSTDGLAMADLPTVEQLEGFIADSGLRTEHVLDLTERVKASLSLIADGYVRALVDRRIGPSPLIDSYLAWYMLTEQGPLGYALVRAVKP